jgi:hypothetical protein
VNSAILWSCQSFYFAELSHFVVMNSSICFTELSHFCYITQSFSDFFTVNSAILWFCYTEPIHFCYSELGHFVILTDIFSTLNSVIFATVLNHFLLLQCYARVGVGSVRAGARGATQDQAVQAGHKASSQVGGGARRRARERDTWLGRFGWLVGLSDGPLVHHSRWWIADPYIYIYTHMSPQFLSEPKAHSRSKTSQSE